MKNIKDLLKILFVGIAALAFLTACGNGEEDADDLLEDAEEGVEEAGETLDDLGDEAEDAADEIEY